MYRMLTLIWAMGVLLFASHAQAVTPMGEKIGSVRTEAASGQKSQKAHLTKRRTKSTRATRHASRAKAHTRRASRAHVKRTSRTADSQTVRSRRVTSTSNSRSAKRNTATRKRHHVAVGTVMSGKASYYWQPQRVASGGWFNPKAMTAAHKTLPFGTKVKVTNARNGRTVHVTINDRGPYVGGRIIDLSDAAAGAIGMKSAGVVPVKVEVVE